MKANIHPKWHDKALATCACGNTFTFGATFADLSVDVCAKCHPYFTGQMKYVDTAGRVDAFKARQKAAKKKVLSKADRRKIKRLKRVKEELSRPDTLAQLRKSAK